VWVCSAKRQQRGVRLRETNPPNRQPTANRPQIDPKSDSANTQRALAVGLPLMVGYFALCVPSGLSLYYFSNTVFTGMMQVRGRVAPRLCRLEGLGLRLACPWGTRPCLWLLSEK
jgi:hypothetical protein